MENDSAASGRRYVLPTILIAAVTQGSILYALHRALENKIWPATDLGWLLACYSIAVFVPITAQFLASYAKTSLTWLLIAAVGILFGYFGWHQGSWVVLSDPTQEPYSRPESGILLAFILGLIWLLGMPFAQMRLATGSWRPAYPALFSTAWRNKLMLAEAALFSGLFWILLVLWQELFHMLGLNFFRELFSKPIFIYPVTSIVFGIALHLIGSVERLTSMLLEQLLNVLKWLSIVAGVLLVVFTFALIFKLPGLITSHERPISAAWLLWLLACLVLLINAAYRDGTIPQPYPRAVGLALRFAVPLTIVIALTACYAIWIRIHRYGFTVERVWACVVALTALAYAVGYSFAVRAKDVWMHGVARINVYVALSLIAVLMLTLTPAVSPYRIAANSLFRQLASGEQTNSQKLQDDALQYLRFDAGRYGLERLRQLASVKTGTTTSGLAAAAHRLLETNNRGESRARNIEDAFDKLAVYPKGVLIDPELMKTLREDIASPAAPRSYVLSGNQPPAGLFIDMNGDEVEEFVLLGSNQSALYRQQDGLWRYVGLLSPTTYPDSRDVISQLDAGNFSASVPRWRELKIGDRYFRYQGEP